MLHSSHATAPDDLLIFTDADAVVNAVETSAGLLRRFNAARTQLTTQAPFRLVFQAEPFCWAPWAEAWPSGRICSPEVVGLYKAQGYLQLPPRCPRFLNSGGYAGLVRDISPILRQWRDGARVLSGAKPGAAWPGTAPQCFRGDQCVATNLMLRSNGSIGLDIREQLFASAYLPVLPMMKGWGTGFRGGGALSCGDVKCRAHTKLADSWHFVNSQSSADAGHFERPEEYRAVCHVQVPSTMIHFQGIMKGLLKSSGTVTTWLRRRDQEAGRNSGSVVSSVTRRPPSANSPPLSTLDPVATGSLPLTANRSASRQRRRSFSGKLLTPLRKATDLKGVGPMPVLDIQPFDLSPSGGRCVSTGSMPPPAAGNEPLRSLVVVHTTIVDAKELVAHGRMMARSAQSWLLRGTLLLAVNGDLSKGLVASTLNSTLDAYPQRHRMLCRLPNNGYLCGQFADWHRLAGGLWAQYEVILFVESDVYVTPLAIRTLEVTMLGENSGGSRETRISAAVWYVAYWLHRRSSAYNMDLFALVPDQSAFTDALSTNASLQGRLRQVWYNAYQDCLQRVAQRESPRGLSERSFFKAVRNTQIPVVVLLNETTHGDRKIDRMGVWHTHNTSAVVDWLEVDHQTGMD